jgi:hypothetical protein
MSLILSGTDGLSDVDGTAGTPAIRGTDANTGIFFPAADTIAFSEGGVEAMRIDSSGNVGIGTSSPLARLDVRTTSQAFNQEATISAYSTDAQGINLGGSIALGGNADIPIRFGLIAGKKENSTSGNRSGYLQLATFENGVGLVERMRLNSTGAVILQGGTTTATGVGITFPATQSASSDANTLDDYEEGTWTPTFEGGTTNPTLTYDAQVARYTKIGNVVTVNGRIRVGSISSAGSGTCFIAGLPFATANITNLQNAGCIGTAFNWATTNHGAPDGISADSAVTRMVLRVYKNDAGKVSGWTTADAADLQNDSAVDFQMTYRV